MGCPSVQSGDSNHLVRVEVLAVAPRVIALCLTTPRLLRRSRPVASANLRHLYLVLHITALPPPSVRWTGSVCTSIAARALAVWPQSIRTITPDLLMNAPSAPSAIPIGVPWTPSSAFPLQPPINKRDARGTMETFREYEGKQRISPIKQANGARSARADADAAIYPWRAKNAAQTAV